MRPTVNPPQVGVVHQCSARSCLRSDGVKVSYKDSDRGEAGSAKIYSDVEPIYVSPLPSSLLSQYLIEILQLLSEWTQYKKYNTRK